MRSRSVILCPGQGAQAVGMGTAWFESSEAARRIFREADDALGNSLGAPLSQLCFNGPAERLNQTDVSQPAIYVCSVASYHGLVERGGEMEIIAAAGLSLGEYTALHLAGAFGFLDGLNLVRQRGKLMHQAAETSRGGMVALIGADEAQAQSVCETAAQGDVLVCANFNAPGQIVLSGHTTACQRALAAAEGMGLKATPLTVAGAFHSPLMQQAAEGMATVLDQIPFHLPDIRVWSNVTATPHPAKTSQSADLEQLKRRLVEQIVRPVRWSQSCQAMAADSRIGYESAWNELAPGGVLRGLMRRIDRNVKVTSHDEP
jgi:[acyl-carrier-protein] S-malonyltransferase